MEFCLLSFKSTRSTSFSINFKGERLETENVNARHPVYMPMRSRRRFLQTVGAGAVVGIAGCNTARRDAPKTKTETTTTETGPRPLRREGDRDYYHGPVEAPRLVNRRAAADATERRRERCHRRHAVRVRWYRIGPGSRRGRTDIRLRPDDGGVDPQSGPSHGRYGVTPGSPPRTPSSVSAARPPTARMKPANRRRMRYASSDPATGGKT